MKIIAKLNITDGDPRIKQVPTDERDSKIDLLYSLGYVYNPFSKEFYNPFIHKILKPIAIYNLDLNRIINVHKHIEGEFLKKNERFRTLDEILDSVRTNSNPVSRLWEFLEILAGHISIVLLLVTVVLHFNGNIYMAAISLGVTFIFARSYVLSNLLTDRVWGDGRTSRFWKRYRGLFVFVSLLLYPYLYYMLYLLLESIIPPNLWTDFVKNQMIARLR